MNRPKREKPSYLQEPDSEDASVKEIKSDLDRYVCRFDVRSGLPLLYPEFLVLLVDLVLQQEYEAYDVSQLDRLKDYNGGSIPWSHSANIGNSRVFLGSVPSFVKRMFMNREFKWRFAFLSVLSSRWLISLHVLECFVEDCAEGADGDQTLPADWAWVNGVKIPDGPHRFSVTLIASGSHVFARLKLKPVSIDPQSDFVDESRLSRKFPEDLLHAKLLQMVPHCSSRLSKVRFAIGEVGVHQYVSDEMANKLASRIRSIFDHTASKSDDWANAANLCRQFGAESLYAHAHPRNPNAGFKNMIENSLSLCGKVYLPVAVSSGQGSSYRMTMASFQQSTETPLKFSFSQSTWDDVCKSIASLQKGLVRMSLLKTPSVPCGCDFSVGSMSDCWSNHAENGATMPFSDGCGIISLECLKRCWEHYCQKMNLQSRTFMMGYGVEQLNHISAKEVPCAIQIRLAGVKGMLVVCDDAKLMKGFDILIRKDSMIKFFPPDSFPEHRVLELVNFSCASEAITLNIELMAVLVKAGVKLEFLQSVCEEYWMKLFASQEDIRLAQLKSGDLAGLNMSLHAETNGSSNLGLFISICVPLRFKLPDSGLFFGVADFTGTLKPGEVFLKPSRGTIDSEQLLIMKDPCLKERDIMRVRICKNPDQRIAKLRDVVVFACPNHITVESRCVPDPFRVAGSDLDGDQFLCIWNASVQQQCKTNERLSKTEDFFRRTEKGKEKNFTDEVQPADLWKEGIHSGEQLMELFKKQNGLQPWDKCADAKSFQDQRDREMREKVVAAGKSILSPLLGEVGYVPFNELRVIRQNYLCNWLEGGIQDSTLFESAEELGKCATDAVDAVKSGKWLKEADLTEKARDAILKEPSGFTFDWSICRNVIFNDQGFLTKLICYGARLLKIDVGSLSQPGLSFADEMHLQSAVCRILSLKNRKNEKNLMVFPVLPPDISQQEMSIFRRMAQFSLFWKVFIARSVLEYEQVRVIVSSCPVQNLPAEDQRLLLRQSGKIFLARSGNGEEKVLDGCASGLLKYYDIGGEQFRNGLVKEFLNGFGVRSYESRPLFKVPDPMEYSAIHPSCDNYVKLSRLPEQFFRVDQVQEARVIEKLSTGLP